MLTAGCKMSEGHTRGDLEDKYKGGILNKGNVRKCRLLVPGAGIHSHSMNPELSLKSENPETPKTKEDAKKKKPPRLSAVRVKSKTGFDSKTCTTVKDEPFSDISADRVIKHECPFCNKIFTKKHNLKQHMRVHTGEKPFCCSFCKQLFGHKSALKVHLRIHTGEKPYCCSICTKNFVQRDHLQVHMRTHTGEKPYSCSVCEKTFTRNCFLIGHMRTHTGEKPFRCSACEKTFTFKYKLDVHMRTHTGERPYSCTKCNAAFTQKPHLDKHKCKHAVKRESAEVSDNSVNEVEMPI